MTLDEAIIHAEEVAAEKDKEADSAIVEQHAYFCHKCAMEHRQLVEWLKELKEWREKS